MGLTVLSSRLLWGVQANVYLVLLITSIFTFQPLGKSTTAPDSCHDASIFMRSQKKMRGDLPTP